jgi:hypothetical protein
MASGPQPRMAVTRRAEVVRGPPDTNQQQAQAQTRGNLLSPCLLCRGVEMGRRRPLVLPPRTRCGLRSCPGPRAAQTQRAGRLDGPLDDLVGVRVRWVDDAPQTETGLHE